MQFFDYIKVLYEKGKVDFEVDNTLNHTLTKWLSYDKETIQYIKRVCGFFGRVCSKTYFRLLYLNIPKKRVPFLRKEKRLRSDGNEIYNVIKQTLQWSDKEYKLQEDIIKKVIDVKYWKKELGVK